MPADWIARTRLAIAALAVGPVLFLGVLVFILPGEGGGPFLLSGAATLVGLLAAPLAWRSFRAGQERLELSAEEREWGRPRFRIHVVPVAITEAAALLGGFAFAFARDPWTLAGIVVHLVIAGAVWPRESLREDSRTPSHSGTGSGEP
jgi:hypothetical protein